MVCVNHTMIFFKLTDCTVIMSFFHFPKKFSEPPPLAKLTPSITKPLQNNQFFLVFRTVFCLIFLTPDFGGGACHKLSLFHINTCSLNKNFKDLEYLLKTINTNYTNIVKNINIPNFPYEFTPTESTDGGTLLYIADHLVHQKRNDLNLY